MKKIRRSLLLLLFAVLIMGMSASAGFKRMPNGKYRYYTSKKKYLKGKKSKNPESTKRWTFKRIKSNGKTYTYCFDEKGYMLIGTQKIYTKPAGQEAGWRTYRFSNNGRLIGMVNQLGALVDGTFVKTKKGMKYQYIGGNYITKQWALIEGHWYYLYSNGIMAKKAKVGSHYVDENGHLVY